MKRVRSQEVKGHATEVEKEGKEGKGVATEAVEEGRKDKTEVVREGKIE